MERLSYFFTGNVKYYENSGLQIRVLNRNYVVGIQKNRSFRHPKHMFELIDIAKAHFLTGTINWK